MCGVPISTDLIVLQSAPSGWPGWIHRCLDSVANWAERNGIERRLIGDELFEPVPMAWRSAAGSAKLPVTDYARLLWMDRLHRDGYRHVIWLDSDILVINQDFSLPRGDFFCRELWIYRKRLDQRIFATPKVNNCAMGFTAASSLFEWYLDACARAPDAGPLHRLAIGPILLTERQMKQPMPLIETVPTISPVLMDAIVNDNEELMDSFRDLWCSPIEAAHLCRSLGQTEDAPALVHPDIYDILIDKIQRGSLDRPPPAM